MQEGTTGQAEVVRLRQSIETQMRRRILEAIEVVLEEELTEALGTGRYERGEARRGHRNGREHASDPQGAGPVTGARAPVEEGGERLLTFYAYPKPLWRALRTTNTLENLNREFRRRTKTQASFSTEEAAVTLLYALVAFGQIQLRKIDGHRHILELFRANVAAAA
jgi:transposase-like protein